MEHIGCYRYTSWISAANTLKEMLIHLWVSCGLLSAQLSEAIKLKEIDVPSFKCTKPRANSSGYTDYYWHMAKPKSKLPRNGDITPIY